MKSLIIFLCNYLYKDIRYSTIKRKIFENSEIIIKQLNKITKTQFNLGQLIKYIFEG